MKGKYFPLAAALSQRLTRRLTTARGTELCPLARPTVNLRSLEYSEDGRAKTVHTVVIAIQHDSKLKDMFDGDENKELEYVRDQVKQHVVEHSIPKELLGESYRLVVNGTEDLRP